MPGAHVHALVGEHPQQQRGHILVLARQQARRHLDLGHAAAEPRERQRQLAADRTTAQHQQPARLLAQRPQAVGRQVADAVEAGQLRHQRPRAGGDDDRAGADPPAGDLDFPRRHDPRFAHDAVDAQAGVAFDRVVRLHRGDDLLHAFHHLGEVERRLDLADPELAAVARIGQQARAADQGLGRHAARVEAVAAHLVPLDQRDLGFHRGADVGADQARGAGADHDEVVVEARGLAVAAIDAPRGDQVGDPAHQQGQHADRHERADQPRREDPGEAVELRELGAGIDEHDRARQHADLTDAGIGERADRRQAHQQVDQEERKGRHQAQGEQVEGTIAAHAFLERRQALAELRPHRVAEQEARGDEGQRRTERARERHRDRAGHQAEQGAAGQGHDGRTRQRKGRHRDIGDEERCDGRGEVRVHPAGERFARCLERIQGQEAVEVEREECGNRGEDQGEQDDTGTGHGGKDRIACPDLTPSVVALASRPAVRR